MAQALPYVLLCGLPHFDGADDFDLEFRSRPPDSSPCHMWLTAARGTESNLQYRFQLPGQVVRVKGPG